MSISNCTTCGAAVVDATGRVALAKDTAVFLEGVRIRTCANGHKHSTSIPKLGKASDLAVQALIDKPWGLAPGEFRMLRLHTGLNAKQLAAVLGVAPETVSRWEHAKMGISPLADRAIRLVATHGKAPTLRIEDLAAVDGTRNEPLELTLQWDGSSWHVVEFEQAVG